MVIFDVGMGFGIGCLFKRYAKRDARNLVTIACALGVTPAAMAFLGLYPDWDLQYLIPKESLPDWFAGVFCFCITAAGLLGHQLQQKWNKTVLLFYGIYGAYCLWSLTRIFTVTSYSEFHAGVTGQMPPIFFVHLAIFGLPATAIILFAFKTAISTKQTATD